jgi:hypothetical protein
MSKLITYENKEIKIKEELLKESRFPVWLFWTYCYLLLEPQIKNRTFKTLVRDRMVGNRLAKYRKKRKLKELGIKLLS